MKYLVNSKEMKRCDAYTMEEIGMPSLVLMERAALLITDELLSLPKEYKKKILVVCGGGNNGGDGLAIARLLYLKGLAVEVLFLGKENRCTEETRSQLQILRAYHVPFKNNLDLESYTTIVDAIFGVGLTRDIEGAYFDTIQRINESKAYVVSVDVPSGVNADNGKIMGIGVKAHETITLAYSKVGLILYPGAEYAGDIKIKDIGITDLGFQKELPKVFTHEKEDLLKIPVRKAYSNKGTYGKVLVIAGSINMSGAAYFSAKAAYLMGAGLVYVYTPLENRQIMQTLLPEAVLITYDTKHFDPNQIINLMDQCDTVVLGPGLSTKEYAKQLVKVVVEACEKPLIIDADAINIIAKDGDLKAKIKKNMILTPHLGELARLTELPISSMKEDLIQKTREIQTTLHAVIVCKDTRTVVVGDTPYVYLNTSGNDGMATGGSGDILTGILAGLLAQKMSVYEASTIGVYLHGLAGDYVREKKNRYSMIAEDLLNGIIMVMNERDLMNRDTLKGCERRT